MPIRFTLLILLTTLVSVSSALPLAESKPCDVNDADCKQVIDEENITAVESSTELVPEVASKNVLDLVATRFVTADLSKLLDKKTAILLNTASYSIGVGKNLLGDFSSRNYLVGSAVNDSYGSTAGNSSANKNVGNTRWRDWATPDKNRRPDRYKGSEAQSKAEKEEQQATSWMSKSASIAEYAAVVLLGLVFWVWLRQSKTF